MHFVIIVPTFNSKYGEKSKNVPLICYIITMIIFAIISGTALFFSCHFHRLWVLNIILFFILFLFN